MLYDKDNYKVFANTKYSVTVAKENINIYDHNTQLVRQFPVKNSDKYNCRAICEQFFVLSGPSTFIVDFAEDIKIEEYVISLPPVCTLTYNGLILYARSSKTIKLVEPHTFEVLDKYTSRFKISIDHCFVDATKIVYNPRVKTTGTSILYIQGVRLIDKISSRPIIDVDPEECEIYEYNTFLCDYHLPDHPNIVKLADSTYGYIRSGTTGIKAAIHQN